MLSEKQIEIIGDEFASIFQKLEQDVIKDITRRVAKTGRWTETAEIQAKSLRELGYSPKDIRDKVIKELNQDVGFIKWVDNNTLEHKKKVSKVVEDTVNRAKRKGDKLVSEAGNMAFNSDLTLWKKAGKNLTKKGQLAKQIGFYQNQVRKEVDNITGSMGFVNGTDKTKINDVFTKELNEAIIKVSSGAFTKEQAIADMTKRLTTSGVRKIDFKSGASRNIDTSARLAIQTTSTRLSASIMMDNLESMNHDLVEVSHHAGARDEGIGAINHASWQGKVYSISGKPYPKESQRLGYKIEKLETMTGYPNDPSGLCGYNCRHTFYPFFEGISEEIEPEEEPSPIIWNGRLYNHYEATQKQRQYEREIRTLKRRKACDDNVSEALLINKNNEYKAFCLKADLKVNTNRIRVYGVKDYISIPKPTIVPKKPAIPKELPKLKAVDLSDKVAITTRINELNKWIKKIEDYSDIMPWSEEVFEQVEKVWEHYRTEVARLEKIVNELEEVSKLASGFIEAKTIKEANQFAESMGFMADYKGIDIRCANEWNKGLYEAKIKFPEVAEQIRFVGSTQQRYKLMYQEIKDYYYETGIKLGYEKNIVEQVAIKKARKEVEKFKTKATTWASSFSKQYTKKELYNPINQIKEKYRGIAMNNKVYNNYDKVIERGKILESSKWSPKGCFDVKATFDHEFAHQIDDYLKLREDKLITQLYNSFSNDELKELLSEYSAGTYTKNLNFKKHKDAGEMIAEAWSEYCNNPKPRKVAEVIGERIEALWKKKRNI